ncbi:MAG: M48 family metallopeptidase [Bdellovibrionales bacterium]|nr:M48 family metallopeptidase [Bdellovibrionales bacterium]
MGTLVFGCSTSPQERKQLIFASQQRVESAGIKAFERMKRRNITVQNEHDNNYVRCVVEALDKKISPRRNWEIVIFRSDEANAFALPGNKIGITSGLLRVAVNQDQLATVLGHEMGHILAEHGRERMSQQIVLSSVELAANILGRSNSSIESAGHSLVSAAQIGLLYPFSKVHESEADKIGLELAAKAGFKPSEAIPFWQNMNVYGGAASPTTFSGHPSNEQRMVNLQIHMTKAVALGKMNPERVQCEK